MLQFETRVLADEFVALKLKPRVGWETCLSKILTSYPNLLNKIEKQAYQLAAKG
jgi:hypothetical protein